MLLFYVSPMHTCPMIMQIHVCIKIILFPCLSKLFQRNRVIPPLGVAYEPSVLGRGVAIYIVHMFTLTWLYDFVGHP
ncbi:hypothetical protein ABKN59_007999 [Abortiporus biennis]